MALVEKLWFRFLMLLKETRIETLNNIKFKLVNTWTMLYVVDFNSVILVLKFFLNK